MDIHPIWYFSWPSSNEDSSSGLIGQRETFLFLWCLIDNSQKGWCSLFCSDYLAKEAVPAKLLQAMSIGKHASLCSMSFYRCRCFADGFLRLSRHTNWRCGALCGVTHPTPPLHHPTTLHPSQHFNKEQNNGKISILNRNNICNWVIYCNVVTVACIHNELYFLYKQIW